MKLVYIFLLLALPANLQAGRADALKKRAKKASQEAYDKLQKTALKDIVVELKLRNSTYTAKVRDPQKPSAAMTKKMASGEPGERVELSLLL